MRRWNQTGQKFAGAPDIVNSYFPDHTTLLWILIGATYSDVFLRLLKRAFTRHKNAILLFGFTFTVALSTFGFKISFAAQDAPEMVPFWLESSVAAMSDLELVMQARAAFIAVFGGMAYTVFEGLFLPIEGKQSHLLTLFNLHHYCHDIGLGLTTIFPNSRQGSTRLHRLPPFLRPLPHDANPLYQHSALPLLLHHFLHAADPQVSHTHGNLRLDLDPPVLLVLLLWRHQRNLERRFVERV